MASKDFKPKNAFNEKVVLTQAGDNIDKIEILYKICEYFVHR